MFEGINKQSKIIDYDFRKTANPDDSLAYLLMNRSTTINLSG